MSLRDEVEALAKEWTEEAERRLRDAKLSVNDRKALELGAAFELSHARALRAALAVDAAHGEDGARERETAARMAVAVVNAKAETAAALREREVLRGALEGLLGQFTNYTDAGNDAYRAARRALALRTHEGGES